MLGVTTHRLLEELLHCAEVPASSGDAGKVVERQTGGRIPEVKSPPDVVLGLVEHAFPVVGAAEVDVRGVVVAQPVEDRPVLLDSFVKTVAEALVLQKPFPEK